MMQVRDYKGRFAGSCISTCGMPSSHSMLATGWFMILLVDRISRVDSFLPSASRPPNCIKTACKHLRRSLLPWSTHNLTITQEEFAVHLLVWLCLLIPVPWMRVVLYDHSVEQAMYGTFAGLALALAWSQVVRNLQRCFKRLELEFKPWPSSRCTLIKHDFVLERANPLLVAMLKGQWNITDHFNRSYIGTNIYIDVLDGKLVAEGFPSYGEIEHKQRAPVHALFFTEHRGIFELKTSTFMYEAATPGQVTSACGRILLTKKDESRD